MTVALDKQRKVITGKGAAAWAAMLCRPDVVAAYPITPQSEVIEQLAKFHADGVLDCQYVTVEGENSAQNVVCAATMAGGRAFTATSSYGLVYMYDAMFNTAGYRAPVVMINVNREPPGIHAVCSGQQDMISVRDTGWVQLIVEDCQEILDTTIMAFRLAEDLDRGFRDAFGRGYGGQIEEYRTEDADIVLVTSGSAVGTARTMIDAKREEGVKAGLVKLRLYRPFPVERLSRALAGRKAIGV